MKYLLVALFATAALAQGPPPALGECETCEFLVAQAQHHFRNGTTEAQLKENLLNECQHLGRQDGQDAVQNCITIVNNNIDKIYSDTAEHDTAGQTCYDIGECTYVPTFPTHGPHPSFDPNHTPGPHPTGNHEVVLRAQRV